MWVHFQHFIVYAVFPFQSMKVQEKARSAKRRDAEKNRAEKPFDPESCDSGSGSKTKRYLMSCFSNSTRDTATQTTRTARLTISMVVGKVPCAQTAVSAFSAAG